VPEEYLGNVMTLCNQKRGAQIDMKYHGHQVMLKYDLPLNEVVMDFFDKLKSTSRGYASLDYEFKEFRATTWSSWMSWSMARRSMPVADRAPFHFSLSWSRTGVQDARADSAPDVRRGGAGGDRFAHHRPRDGQGLRKNVLAKCYGGDITRKKKLLEKQKEGKKRMKQVGNVEIPQEAFLAILQVGDK
jgi:GTP-binding protein LepA